MVEMSQDKERKMNFISSQGLLNKFKTKQDKDEASDDHKMNAANGISIKKIEISELGRRDRRGSAAPLSVKQTKRSSIHGSQKGRSSRRGSCPGTLQVASRKKSRPHSKDQNKVADDKFTIE